MTSIPTTTKEYRIEKYDGFHSITLKESPIVPPKSNEVLVKVHAVSLNSRDITIANGKYPSGLPPNLVPCSDMAGEVLAVGDDVHEWAPGDRVCANFGPDFLAGDVTPKIRAGALGSGADGVLTQYKVFPAHSLVTVPNNLSHEEASTLPCAAVTAYNALHGPTPLKGGDSVLIIGTGGVSIFGLQFAAAAGATVIATSSSDKKLEIARKFGANHLINYKTTPKWDEEVLTLTKGRGVDHVIEIGGPGSINKSLKSVRMAGWVHAVGFLAQKDDEEANLLRAIVSRGAMVRGILVGSVSQFKSMNRLIEARDIHPVVDKVFEFDQVKEAYQYLESQVHVGKVVIKVA